MTPERYFVIQVAILQTSSEDGNYAPIDDLCEPLIARCQRLDKLIEAARDLVDTFVLADKIVKEEE